jgi:3-isopropylmalate/(R)-2-methylmalate dehydratase small subunit
VNTLMRRAKDSEGGYTVTVDLERCLVEDDQGFSMTFDVDPFKRHRLLNGLDDIGLTLQHEADISTFEEQRPAWIQAGR